MKDILYSAMILSLVFATSCSKEKDKDKTVAVTDVTLNRTTSTLNVSGTKTLTATVLPENATNKSVSWSSNNTAVATVNNGVVTAVALGSATITVTTSDGNKTAICAITVAPVPVTGVSLNYSLTTRVPGDLFSLTATILPLNATNKALSWSSNDETVATVDNGLVTTKSPGIATIVVTTVDGNFTAVSSLTVATGCSTATPGWGTSLGTVSFATSQEWTISDNGITQIWSDAVLAYNCNKATFDGGSDGNYKADGRSNPDQKGNLFSWVAVIRFQDQLCPAPWRIPSMQDFINLDLAMGGTGEHRTNWAFVNTRYFGLWGGAFGGICESDGTLNGQGMWASYWSASEYFSMARSLYFDAFGNIHTQGHSGKEAGFTLRCVR